MVPDGRSPVWWLSGCQLGWQRWLGCVCLIVQKAGTGYLAVVVKTEEKDKLQSISIFSNPYWCHTCCSVTWPSAQPMWEDTAWKLDNQGLETERYEQTGGVRCSNEPYKTRREALVPPGDNRWGFPEEKDTSAQLPKCNRKEWIGINQGRGRKNTPGTTMFKGFQVKSEGCVRKLKMFSTAQ